MATINHRDTVLLVIALLAARAINAMVRLRQSYGLSDSTQAAPFPEDGPLGESVYFTDPIGNHFEVCWRRDEHHEYHPVIVGGD